jgi:hypothetical protein
MVANPEIINPVTPSPAGGDSTVTSPPLKPNAINAFASGVWANPAEASPPTDNAVLPTVSDAGIAQEVAAIQLTIAQPAPTRVTTGDATHLPKPTDAAVSPTEITAPATTHPDVLAPVAEAAQTLPDGTPLETRDDGSIQHIKFMTKSEYDASDKSKNPANFEIDADGNLKPVLDPSKGPKGDKDVVIVIDDKAGAQVDAINAAQMAAAIDAYQQMAAQYTNAGLEAPPQIMPQLIPRPAAVVREQGPTPGTANYGPIESGGNTGGNGSFAYAPPRPGQARRSYDMPDSSAKIDWAHLNIKGLDKNNPVDRIIAMIMGPGHEGASFNTVQPNDNGHGVSFGGFQYNQGVGELPMLLQAIAKADPAASERVFGKAFTQELINSPESIRSMSSSKLASMLTNATHDAGWESVNEKTQLGLMRQKIAHAEDVARKYHLVTPGTNDPPEKAVALVADIINQRGDGGAASALRAAVGMQGDVNSKLKAVVSNDLVAYNRRGRDLSILNSSSFSDHEGVKA